MPQLFSYGTLQRESVQQQTFGRLLKGQQAILSKFMVAQIKITDSEVIAKSGLDIHPILRYTGNIDDTVAGMVFDITEHELALSDEYEVDDYHRIEAQLTSGLHCWVYVAG